jgi:single-strand DNA-binding protein
MNKCCFVGWIANDVELKEGRGNVKYVRIRVAVRRSGPVKEDQQRYDYIPCVAFNKTAEFISRYFKKGDYISLTTSYRTSKYVPQDGETKYSHDFWVEDAGFCSPPANGGNSGAGVENVNAAVEPSVQVPLEIPF